jgi:hypothetical protein
LFQGVVNNSSAGEVTREPAREDGIGVHAVETSRSPCDESAVKDIDFIRVPGSKHGQFSSPEMTSVGTVIFFISSTRE